MIRIPISSRPPRPLLRTVLLLVLLGLHVVAPGLHHAIAHGHGHCTGDATAPAAVAGACCAHGDAEADAATPAGTADAVRAGHDHDDAGCALCALLGAPAHDPAPVQGVALPEPAAQRPPLRAQCPRPAAANAAAPIRAPPDSRCC